MLGRLVLKENEIFAVTDGEGNIAAHSADGQGLYFRDTRFLSLYQLTIDRVPLQALASTGDLNFTGNFQFTNAAGVLPGDIDLPPRTLSVRRNRFIDSGLHERIGLVNYNPYPITVTLRLTYGSDFRDMFDVRGYHGGGQRGVVQRPLHRGRSIRLRYAGRDRVARTTEILFDVDPTRVERLGRAAMMGPRPSSDGAGAPADPRAEVEALVSEVEASFTVTLKPREPWSLAIHIVPVVGRRRGTAEPSPSIDRSFQRIYDAYTQWESACTRIATDNELLNQLISQSLRDLRLTINNVATGLLPVGGIPWFAVPFGRDGLITSVQTLCLNPDIAYGTLRFLAAHQGKRVDLWRDEEPGKILHEIRSGEMAALGQVPQTPYYGSIDSTPLFVYLLTQLLKWTDDWVLAADLRPHLDQAMEWIRLYGDRDGDGLVEYYTSSGKGIRNQGWKDSYDAIAFPNGRFAEPPIAVAEVQGYVFAAQMGMAQLYRRWGDERAAERCLRLAGMVKERFDAWFWLEAEQYYALALDARKMPVPAVASNPGHCLLMDLLDGPRADAVARRLIQDDMLCGWGVRTLSSAYPTFNPLSYHNGSVWPHDTSLVAAGLRHRGYDDAALRIIDEVFSAGFELPGFRMPELFCGFSRDRHYRSSPAPYPVACVPQSWAAGSVFLLLQHLLGIEPDLPSGRLVLRPRLLPWLNQISFENMRLGARRISLRAWREGPSVRCEVQGAEDLDVVLG